MDYIRHLPINDTPEIFGLHENANITFAQNETFSLLNGILKLQPKSSSGVGRSREEVNFFWSCIKDFSPKSFPYFLYDHNCPMRPLLV